MGLRIIYGRSGSGKTTYCLNQMKEKINDKRKLFLITPEQFSFNAEKRLLETMRIEGGMTPTAVINAEVLTFKRMAYRVFNEVGGSNLVNLSSCGKAMLIYHILDKNKDKLKLLSMPSALNGNVNILSTMITELKKHNVTLDDLKQTIEKTNDKLLKMKLKEIIDIYKDFEEVIQNNFTDIDDELTLLYNKMDLSKMFEGVEIWIDEFNGFTGQEYMIIEKLVCYAKQVNITICTDNLDEPINETDLFLSNKKTIKRLIEIAKEQHILIDKPVRLFCVRFKSQELSHLEKNLYTYPYEIYIKEIENILMFLAQNPYSEIEYVAQNIVNLVKNYGYRYRDIGIITKNVEIYSSLIEAVFSKYNIPKFIDEKKDLSLNIIIKFIVSLLEIYVKNWSYDSVFNYLKTGLLQFDKDDINILENYILEWDIKGSTWYKEDFKFTQYKNDNSEEDLNKINYIRKQVCEPLLEFKQDLMGKKTVKEITKSIYDFIVKMNIPNVVEDKIQNLKNIGEIEIANEYESVWNNIVEVFDELVLLLGDTKITFENYQKLFKIGIGEKELGKIPATIDQVIVGDTDRTKSNKVKVIFIIGLNDGVFPSTRSDEGFLNDKDRKILEELNINLAKGTKEKLYEEQFNIYKAFTTAEEKIYFSYPTSDLESKALRPAVLVSKLKKMFINLKEESDLIENNKNIQVAESAFEDLLVNIRKWQDGEQIDKVWFMLYKWYINNPEWKSKIENALKGIEYINKNEKIAKGTIKKLYGDTLHTSVSRLESYRMCPFSYHLKYGLKIKDRNVFKIESIDIGSFMHNVIDKFFGLIEIEGIKVKEINKEWCKEKTEQIVEEMLKIKSNYIFSSKPKYVALSIKLKKLLSRAVWMIIYQLKCGNFEPLGHEVTFGREDFSPITMELPTGEKIELTGKIDRVDICETEEGKYIRIIDYKSSGKELSLSNVYYGLQLQLITYLDAVTKESDLIPSGVLYFNLNDPIIKSKVDISEEELEKLIIKQFRMKGLILADIKVIKNMDVNIDEDSNILPVKINKDGTLSKNSSVATKEQFEDLQKHIEKILKQISIEILDGNIDINPYYNNKKTPCNFCEYKSICMFDIGLPGNSYNYIDNLDNEEIFAKIKKVD